MKQRPMSPIDTQGKTPAEVAEQILALWKP